MYQLAIFDLDGTLVNSIADLGGTANHLLEQRHLPTHPIDAYYHFVGNGVHKLCERCLPPDTPAAEVETFFAEFNDYYSRHCLDKTAPYDGIPAVLAQLKAAGVHLAVASNKTQPFVETIVRLSAWGLPTLQFDSEQQSENSCEKAGSGNRGTDPENCRRVQSTGGDDR